MEMFTSTPDVIDTGMHMMRILAIGYIAMAVTQILSGVMRGAGDTMTPMWISLITTIVIRVPIAYGLAALMHSADALFISLLISWVMGAVLTSIAFRMGRWKKKSIINDECARTGRCAGLSPISYRKTGQLLCMQTRFFSDRT